MIIEIPDSDVKFLCDEIFTRLRGSPLVPKEAKERIREIQKTIEQQQEYGELK